jgi:uncharacterized membrane protein YfcA
VHGIRESRQGRTLDRIRLAAKHRFLCCLSQVEAQGLGLSVILPAIVIAIPTYTLAGLADWPTGLALGVGTVCTVGFGVALAHRFPERVLRVALCLVVYGYRLTREGGTGARALVGRWLSRSSENPLR